MNQQKSTAACPLIVTVIETPDNKTRHFSKSRAFLYNSNHRNSVQ
jgi:hypothetical protein